ALGQRREEEPARRECGAEECQAEVARQQGSPGDGLEAGEKQRVCERRRDEGEEHDQAREVLPRDDLAVAQGIGPEELERSEPAFLGEETHREQRDEDEKELAHVVELVLPEPQHEVHAAEADVEVEVGVEEPTGKDEEDAGERVEEERGEVQHQLLAGDREHRQDACSRPRASSRTRSRKMSSRRLRPRRAPSSAGVPSPTMRPRAMTTTRSQSASTSERMWLEKSTVRLPRRPRTRSRISTTCAGSSPMVGSSRIRTGGSPHSACATPTRWREPFRSVPTRP